MEVERRLGRSSLSGGFIFAVSQNTTNDRGLGDEGEDLHLSPALVAGQRVDLVDFVNKLGPSFSQRAWRRGRFILSLLLRGVANTRCRGTNAVGVGAVKMTMSRET